jgi:hypothetical protein
MPKRKLDPLPVAAFQIMLALADGDLHGYAIMRQVEAASECDLVAVPADARLRGPSSGLSARKIAADGSLRLETAQGSHKVFDLAGG